MKKIVIIGIILSIIILLFSIYCYYISSIKRIIIGIYESNGDFHSEHVSDSVVKNLNPRNNMDFSIVSEKEDFQITSLTTTLDYKTVDYSYVYKVYSEEKGKEEIKYNDSRNICLHIEFHGLNWKIVSAKEVL